MLCNGALTVDEFRVTWCALLTGPVTEVCTHSTFLASCAGPWQNYSLVSGAAGYLLRIHSRVIDVFGASKGSRRVNKRFRHNANSKDVNRNAQVLGRKFRTTRQLNRNGRFHNANGLLYHFRSNYSLRKSRTSRSTVRLSYNGLIT